MSVTTPAQLEAIVERDYSSMVGREFKLSGLTSAKGRTLNGRRGRVTGRSQSNRMLFIFQQSPPAPPAAAAPEPPPAPILVKFWNLANPDVYCDSPVESPSIPPDELRARLSKVVREKEDECSLAAARDRDDQRARLAFLKRHLSGGGEGGDAAASLAIPLSACMDPMVPEEERNPFLIFMYSLRPGCVGQGTVDLAHFAEGLVGCRGGSQCAICLGQIEEGSRAGSGSETTTAAAAAAAGGGGGGGAEGGQGAGQLSFPCGHVFHYSCAQEWLLHQQSEMTNSREGGGGTAPSCPICRAQLVMAPQEFLSTYDYEYKLELRLKEWVISGMCQRCQMHFHEKDPLVTFWDAALQATRVVPRSRLPEAMAAAFGDDVPFVMA